MATLPLRDAFTARALGVAWNNYKESLGLPPYLGRSFFGTKKQSGLDLRYIKGSKGLPVALKASNFDAQAPLREGIGFSDIQNEMPFYRESYMVTEREEQDYATYLNSVDTVGANQVLSEIMKNPLGLVQGANVIPERQIWQLMAAPDGIPRIKVMIDGKDPYYVDYTPDNGAAYKATNYMEITTNADKWSAPDTATPIQDLLDAKKQHRQNTGEVLSTFVMNDNTWNLFCGAEDTKKQVAGVVAYQNGQMVTESMVKAYMQQQHQIEILVYSGMYQAEDGTSTTFIPDFVVSAIPSNIVTLGDVWYGTTPEERSGSLTDGSLSIIDNGVAVYTYQTNHPINTHCVVSEIVLPSYERMDEVFVIKAY